MPPSLAASVAPRNRLGRQRLTTACVLFLLAGVSLDHRPVPPYVPLSTALLGTLLAVGLALRAGPRTRVLYLAAALFGVAAALSSLPAHRDYPLLGMGRAFYLPALLVLAAATALAWPELRASISQEREKLRTAAVENHRAHTSRELHDETLQALIHLRRSLEHATVRPAQAPTIVGDCATLAADQIVALRDIIADLHPAILTEIGTAAAIEALVERSRRRHPAVQITYAQPTPIDPLDTPTALAVYRITQEAVTNALKHSGAARIEVTVARRRRDLTLEVVDDGGGIELAGGPAGSGGGLGLPAMKARAQLHSGTLTVRSRPGGGTTVSLHLPVRKLRPGKPGTRLWPQPTTRTNRPR